MIFDGTGTLVISKHCWPHLCWEEGLSAATPEEGPQHAVAEVHLVGHVPHGSAELAEVRPLSRARVQVSANKTIKIK